MKRAIVPVLTLCLGGCRVVAGIEDREFLQPFFTPDSGDQLEQIQVASGFVFAWSMTRLVRCPESGCTAPETVVDVSSGSLGGVFFDGETLVHAINDSQGNASTLFTSDLAGDHLVPLCTSTIEFAFVARGDASSYLALGPGGDASSGELHACAISANQQPTSKIQDVYQQVKLFGPPGKALLYGADTDVDDTTLHRCDASGCTVWLGEPLASDGSDSFAVDPDGKVFVLGWSNGSLSVIDEQAQPVEITFQRHVDDAGSGLAVDRENAYRFTGDYNELLAAFGLEDERMTPLADTSESPSVDEVAIALSDDYVYWIDQNHNAVFRVPKGTGAR